MNLDGYGDRRVPCLDNGRVSTQNITDVDRLEEDNLGDRRSYNGAPSATNSSDRRGFVNQRQHDAAVRVADEVHVPRQDQSLKNSRIMCCVGVISHYLRV